MGTLGGRGRLTSTQDRTKALELVEEAVLSGASQKAACKILGISTRTYQRWKNPETPDHDGRPSASRPEPKNKLTSEEKDRILQVINSPEYTDKPPSQIVPDLADKGEYIASESSFYRVMHEAKQQNHRGRSNKSESRPISSHKATGINQVWSWDISYLPGPIKGMYYFLYMIIDIFSRNIVGWEVWEEESAEHSSRLIHRAVLAQGFIRKIKPLVLHSDNGSPMKAATMLATLYELGITPSRSRPRVSNDNPFSESLFKTVKYRPEYPVKGFASLDEARGWCHEFVKWYKHEHKHSKLSFVTPHQVHTGEAEKVLINRRQVYETAKAKNPLRWSRQIRKMEVPTEVWLNPIRTDDKNLRQLP